MLWVETNGKQLTFGVQSMAKRAYDQAQIFIAVALSLRAVIEKIVQRSREIGCVEEALLLDKKTIEYIFGSDLEQADTKLANFSDKWRETYPAVGRSLWQQN